MCALKSTLTRGRRRKSPALVPLARTPLVKFPTAAVSTTIPVNEGNQPPGKTASQIAANVCFAEELNVKR
jgi:hypothetical protein